MLNYDKIDVLLNISHGRKNIVTNKYPAPVRYLVFPTFGRYLKKRFKIQTEGFEQIKDLQGPYIVLSNHVHVLDPIFISYVYPDLIRWVAGAHLFKNRVLDYLLTKWLKSISKQQGRSDMQTVNDIKNALKANEIVGIFPEATRSWDGDTLPFDITTAKLCKIFKVPVIIMNIKGGYGLKPRWTDTKRKGPLTISISKVIDQETVIATKADELYSQIKEAFDFSHTEYVKKNDFSYKGKKQAQGLERLFYICPFCKARSSMMTHGDTVTCSTCGATNTLDSQDFLHSIDGKNDFDTVALWHKAEYKELLNILDTANDDELIFPKDKGVEFFKGEGKKLITISKHFEMAVTKDYIKILFDNGDPDYVYNFNEIQSLVINTKQSLEIFYNDVLYRIRLNSYASAIKYLEIFENFKVKTN